MKDKIQKFMRKNKDRIISVIIGLFIGVALSMCSINANSADLFFDGKTGQVVKMIECGSAVDGGDYKVYVIKEARDSTGSFMAQWMETTYKGVDYKWLVLFSKMSEVDEDDVWIAFDRFDDPILMNEALEKITKEGWSIKKCSKMDEKI